MSDNSAIEKRVDKLTEKQAKTALKVLLIWDVKAQRMLDLINIVKKLGN